MDDWSQFPAADVAETDAPSNSVAATSAADGWRYEVIPDQNGVQRRYATSPDNQHTVAVPDGEVFKGWIDNGAGGRAPQFGPPETAAPQHDATPVAPAQIAGAGAAEATPGEQSDWSQFPEAPKEHSWIDELGIGARAVAEGAGGLAQSLDAPHVIMNKIADLTGLPIGSPEISQIADMVGLPTPTTDREKAASSTIKGAAAAAPLALAGGPLIPALLSGASAGLAGEETRQAGYGPLAQLGASVVAGGVTGAGAAGIGKAATRVFNSTEPSELLAAFQRQQVTPMAAQVGGMGSKMLTSGAKATLGGIPLANAAERSIASAKAARDRIAAGMGSVADDTGAGQAAIRGVNKFIETSSERATKLYNRIPIAPERPAVLSNTKEALAELNAGLSSNAELSAELADGRLQRYEAALAGTTEEVPTGVLDGAGKPLTRTVTKGGKLSWQDLKAFRSYIGELAGRPALQESTSKAALQRLYAGLSEDMRATATREGPDALKAFSRANSFYAARQSRIENTLKLILGNDYQKSPESAFAQIDRWAREGGDAARLSRTIRSLPPDEAATIRATIFSRLGRAAPGQQNANVDAFSPASFSTQWAKLDHRAKSVLFPTAEYRQSLDDIARIAESMKSSEKFANTSGTALAERIGGNLLGATVLGYIFHPTGAIAGEGIGYSAGMLLSWPRFAKWLASSPKKPVGAATLAHINRLSAIAAAEPQIANEVLHLQERLAAAFVPHQAAADSAQDTKQSASPPQPGPGGQ